MQRRRKPLKPQRAPPRLDGDGHRDEGSGRHHRHTTDHVIKTLPNARIVIISNVTFSGKLPHHVTPSSASWLQMTTLTAPLEQYNRGLMTGRTL